MLCHHVPCHQSSRHILPTLPALHPLLLPLPEGGPLSHHPSHVHRLRMSPCRLAWAADHADCLPHISLQAHPIEQAAQGTKCTLDPSWLRRLQPCHRPHRRGNYDAYPLVHTRPTLPRHPPSPSTSSAPPHLPPHWIWPGIIHYTQLNRYGEWYALNLPYIPHEIPIPNKYDILNKEII